MGLGFAGLSMMGLQLFLTGRFQGLTSPYGIVGAIGNGYLDALVGGLAGILIGAGLFAVLYPRLSQGILNKGDFGALTLPKLFKVNDWIVVIPVVALIFLLLYWLERAGL